MAKGLLRIAAALLGVPLLLAPATAGTGAGTPARPWALDGQMVFLRMPSVETAAVMAIAQDRQGFVWLGTQSNLFRWDGYRLHSYARDPDAPGSLPDNFIRALTVDERGQLWVGTNSGGLSRYDAERDGFVSYPVGAGGTRDGNVPALVSDGRGGLWIGTRQGLDHLDGKSGQIEAPQDKMPKTPIAALLLDRSGTLWVGTRNGLLRRAPGSGDFVRYPLPTADGPTPAITALYEDQGSRIWIGTRLHGAFVVEPGSDQARALRESSSPARPMSEVINAICDADNGEVWLGTADNGIVRVNTKTWKTLREQRSLTRSRSLPSNQVDSMYRDHNGLLWVGTRVALARLDPRQRLIQTHFGGTDPGLLIGDETIGALLVQPDGHVWVSLGEGGIDVLDPSAGRIASIRPNPARADRALPKTQVIAMARGPDDSVYLGTAAGLYRASADGRSVVRLQVPAHKKDMDVRTLLVAKDTLWLGGYDGLCELQLLPNGALALRRHFEQELGDTRVRTLLADKSGAGLWIGTPTGVARLDLATNAIARLASEPKNPTALPGGYISSLLTDREGRLWVATFGRGIEVEQGRSAAGLPLFQRLTQRDGLPQNSVDAMELDADGNVWASTDGGLARIEPRELRIRAFRAAQGVGVDGFLTGVSGRTSAGEILFGGLNGIVVVHPERFAQKDAAPSIAITDVHVGSRTLAATQALARGGLQVDSQDRGLAIEFAALDYADPELRRYGYRMLGFDTDWLETPASRRLASYTNLPPGDYTLQLRSAPADGPWTAPLNLAVHVQPEWYQYGFVRALAVILGLSLVGALVQMRTLVLRRRQQQLSRRQVELERLVDERTAALRRSQEDLEKMAYFDTLTGLPNRRMFNDYLRRFVATHRRGHGEFALLLIDLDGFKAVNDSFGHDVGDALLVAVAEQLRSSVRETDLAARLGGDEFGVLLAQPGDADATESTCARIIARLSETMCVEGQCVRVGASAGIVSSGAEGAAPDDLYKGADRALYAAKKAGRNTWRWGRVEVYTFCA